MIYLPFLGTDTDRTFHPGSLSGVQLNQEWLLGQLRVRCCHPDNLTVSANTTNGRVCAKILSTLESEEEILEIMTLQDFSLSLLSSCLLYADAQDKKPLFNASKKGGHIISSPERLISTNLKANPLNWHETGRIYLLVIFGLDFVS